MSAPRSTRRLVTPFEFEAKEGEDSYAVSVSHRGELEFSFEELKSGGVALLLGD